MASEHLTDIHFEQKQSPKQLQIYGTHFGQKQSPKQLQIYGTTF